MAEKENELNAEQIAKLKEVALKAPKNPGEWPFYLRSFQAAANPAAILELIALAERALLAAAPAPIQQVPTAWCTDAHFEAWCERHDMRKDRSDHRQMFDDAASLYLTVPATPPALAWSQVQAAGDAAPISGLPFADLATPIKEFEAKNADQG